MAQGFAPRATRFDGEQTDALLEGGASVVVWGIQHTSDGGEDEAITIEEANSTNIILEIGINNSNTQVMSIPFLAAKGIQITQTAAMETVIFHSSPGA